MKQKNVTVKIQRLLLEYAVIIRNILERHNIPYILIYGSLLGAIRHNGFIPWDDDLDIALFNDTYDDAIKILKRELPNHLVIENDETEPRFYHAWSRVKDLSTRLIPPTKEYRLGGIRVDLFKMHKIKRKDEADFRYNEQVKYLNRRFGFGLLSKENYEERLKQAEIKFIKNKAKDISDAEQEIYTLPSIYNDRFYPEELFPLKRYKFENELFYGPANPANFLSLCYGDYMQLPPDSQRIAHFEGITDADGTPL